MYFSGPILLLVIYAVFFVKAIPMEIDLELNDNSSLRQAVTDNTHLWPNGIVPYQISDAYSAANKAIILSGIQEFAKYTCIQLVPRTTQTDYVIFEEHPSGTCWAGKWGQVDVGHLGGVQYVSLIASQNCVRKFNVIHELMHILGFYHEQQRDDRDQYVNVLYNNINPAFQQVSYEKKSTAQGMANNLGTPYDYNSIMHYHAYAFSTDPSKPAMTATDGCSLFGNEIQFSRVDVLRVNLLYKCPTPYKSPPPKVTYPDNNTNCQSWAASGECAKNPGYMKINCMQSCYSVTGCPSCKDDNAYCPSWATAGYCTNSGYMTYMYSNCRKSCGIC